MLANPLCYGGALVGWGMPWPNIHSKSCSGFPVSTIFQADRKQLAARNSQQQVETHAAPSTTEPSTPSTTEPSTPSTSEPSTKMKARKEKASGFNHSGKMTLAHHTYKRIQDWWHPSKNHPSRPSDYTHRSGKRIWLQCHGCPRCGTVHEWNPRVSDATKTNGNNVCPVCESKAGHFCRCRSVATNPILKREWHEDNPLPPSAVSLGHQHKVKWRCRNCDHVWLAHPAFRSNDGTGCPECGKNCRTRHGSLALVLPDLLDEWDYEKNEKKPEEVTCGSGYPVWWRCQRCNLSWNSIVKARALNGSGCPKCSQEQRFQTRQFAKDSPAYLPYSLERDKVDIEKLFGSDELDE